MNWVILVIAGLFEAFWAYELKLSEGFTKLVPSLLSVGYAVWTGIGIVGAAILGMVVLKEPASAPKIICIALIAAGIIGLNLTTHEG